MKSNRGITLISLVIYMAVVFVVLAALMRITTYFSRNIRDSADVSFETEFNKLNLYLLDESKKTGNAILEITNGTQVTFSNGNKYTYNAEDKKVYLNDNIKICENIDNCLFEQKVAENGKKILTLTITINEITKTTEYVMAKGTEGTDEVNMTDYLWGGSLASYYLKAGDYVDYTPDIGTYKVADGAYGSGIDTTEAGYQEFTTETGESSLKWRVLSIDGKTGKVELVSATALQTLTLQGADGYNHAVDILNDLCETLYSKTVNGTKVAIGRSINVEDINAKTTFDSSTSTYYGDVHTPSSKQYPKIYAKEIGSTANGLNETAHLLEGSKRGGPGIVNSSGVTEYFTYIGSETASTLYSTYTFYYRYEPDGCLNTSLGINTVPRGLITLGNTFWVASRCVLASDASFFGVRCIYPSWYMGYEYLFDSYGRAFTSGCVVRPVVSLSVDLLDFSVGDGSPENPWGMK